ncbi:MAG: DUF4129 domain-containing protein [Peptococcales bacterium]|jgi:hypothetical protein
MQTNRFPYVLFAILAEIAYLYPLYYLLAVGFKTPPKAMLSFWVIIMLGISAVLVNKILYSKRTRILTKIFLNVFLACMIALWLVKTNHYFISGASLNFPMADGAIELLQKSNLVLLILWIWARTLLIFRENQIYSQAVTRFETGIAIIFILFLLAFFFALSIPNGITCLVLFFICSAGTLSLTKWQEEKLTTSLSGLGFTAIILLPLALTLDLFLPYMNSIAGTVYQIATPVLILARDLLAKVLVFLFIKGNLIQDKGTTSSGTNNNTPELTNSTIPEMPLWLGTIVKIIGWLIIIAFIIISVMAFFYFLRKLLKKLLKVENAQSEGGSVELSFFPWLKKFLSRVGYYLKKVWLIILTLLPGKLSIYTAYQALLYWGAFRKYPKKRQETPYEYCHRLTACFPHQKVNLFLITDCYVALKYGNKKPRPETLKQLDISLKKLYLSLFRKSPKSIIDNK